MIGLDEMLNISNESTKDVHVIFRVSYNNEEDGYYRDYNSGNSSDDNEYWSQIDVVVNESMEDGGELQDNVLMI